ncbi:MAG TPA: hypothetical protein DEB06_05265 [Phycisphaerales bacterium]|nr:hypothetical protein [Phycisphaerales bacterium]
MSSDPVHDTIRLSRADLDAVLAELGREESLSGEGNGKRQHRRWRMQSQKAIVTLLDESRNKRHFVAVPRNLSCNGMAFLHGGFVYSGSSCWVTLRAMDGSARPIAAKIVRCQHLKGHLHDLGVAFTERVNPRDFFVVSTDDHLFNNENVNPRSLHGRVLVVDDSRIDQKLLAMAFAGSPVEVIYASDGASALAMLDEEPDLVFMDYFLPDMTGLEVIGRAREQGRFVPMVIISASKDKELRLAAIGAGASEMLFKPLEPTLLFRAAAEYLMSDAESRLIRPEGGCLVMPAHLEPRLSGEMVVEFRRAGNQLEQALHANDREGVLSVMNEVHRGASGIGFTDLAARAGAALALVTRAPTLAPARPEAVKLVRLCQTVRAPGANAAA